MNDPQPVTPPETANKPAIAKREVDLANGTGKLTFANGKVVTVEAAKLPDAVRNSLLIAAALSSMVTAYSAHRDDVGKASEAAEQRRNDLMAGKLPTRGDGTGSMSALDVAIRVRAEAKGIEEAKVRAVVENESEEFQRAFVAKVKADPLTAAAFAALRTRKSKAASEASDKLAELGI